MTYDQLIEIYSAYLPYGPKTDKGILWGVTNNSTVLTKLSDGSLVENDIKNVKLYLNPIERMVEKVDIYDEKDIPIVTAARACINDSFLYDVVINNKIDDQVGFVCAVKFRDCRDVIRILTYSEKLKFSLQITDHEDIIEKRKTVDCTNQYKIYQRLFGLHMNMFGKNKNSFGFENTDFLIKENINDDVVFDPFVSPT